MIVFQRLFLALTLLFTVAVSEAMPTFRITACVVANLQGNPSYFGAATTMTRLKCELPDSGVNPTLAELYQQGWRVIEVLGGNHTISLGNNGPSPLYLLEQAILPSVPSKRSK